MIVSPLAEERRPPSLEPESDPSRLTGSVLLLLLDDDQEVSKRYRGYKSALAWMKGPVRFVYVVAAGNRAALRALGELADAGEPITMLVLNSWEDEAAALRSGLPHTTGDLILTLPAEPEVDASELPALLEAAATTELVLAKRGGGEALALSRLHWVTRKLFRHGFSDLTCNVRVYRRTVLDEIVTYSVPPGLLPLVAAHRGFKIAEVTVHGMWPRRPRTVLGAFFSRTRLLFDVISLYFALNFTRKPLRFFGAIGLPISATGGVLLIILAVQRLAFGSPLADRPLVILAVMLVILGVQILSLGLIAEIIVFVSGKRVRDYTIERILRADHADRVQG